MNHLAKHLSLLLLLLSSFGRPRTLYDLGFVEKTHSRVIHMSNCTNIYRAFGSPYDLYHLGCIFLLRCPAMILEVAFDSPACFQATGEKKKRTTRTSLVHLAQKRSAPLRTTIRLVMMGRTYLFRLLVPLGCPTTAQGSTIQNIVNLLQLDKMTSTSPARDIFFPVKWDPPLV